MVKASASTTAIPGDLVEYLLLGPASDRRLLQDSPILGDVWTAFAAAPLEPQDLLITPMRSVTAGRVAKVVSDRLNALRQGSADRAGANIAYLQGIVAARLHFDEVIAVLVPLTEWWFKETTQRGLEQRFRDGDPFVGRLADIFDRASKRQSIDGEDPPNKRFEPLDRFLALTGLILRAADQPKGKHGAADAVLADAIRNVKSIDRRLTDLYEHGRNLPHVGGSDERGSPDGEGLIFHVSLNRHAAPAMKFSVPAVKADAAQTLFKVSCDKIAWAVLDSGIDASHPAFADPRNPSQSRIRQTLDFSRIRKILGSDHVGATPDDVSDLAASTGMAETNVRTLLKRLAEDAAEERPVSWGLVEKLIKPKSPPIPRVVHGTHVAGIIGANAKDDSTNPAGMCPDIRLYDFRVLARSIEDTEFAVIAALQYIRWYNEQHGDIRIHGANLSLSIPHNVRNFACGFTPICTECERVVESGVVIVAAAGNRGYQNFKVEEGVYEGYAAFSITDPGNADGVITVGSTHPRSPHSYGVSYFSSRGPTGDGRPKPDLVAPGERILAPYPNGDWGQENGTSMAAPHVSGAAAMLMARYSELIGQPRRVKKILCETATDLGRERSFQGYGMLDVLRAFQSI